MDYIAGTGGADVRLPQLATDSRGSSNIHIQFFIFCASMNRAVLRGTLFRLVSGVRLPRRTPFINGRPPSSPRRQHFFGADRLISSSEHIAPTIKDEPTPFNGAIRVNDRMLSVVVCVLAGPRFNRITEAIMQNGWLRWIEIDHRP
jgi:hypothetical protein